MTADEMFAELGYGAEFPIGTHIKFDEDCIVAICVFTDEVYKTSTAGFNEDGSMKMKLAKFTPQEIKAVAKAIEEMEETE